MRTFAREAFEVRKRIESEIYFSRRASELVAVHALGKVGWQMFDSNHFQERQSRINAGGDDIRADLVSVLEYDSFCPPIFKKDPGDRDFRPDLYSSFACSTPNGVGDGARASAHESPGAERPIDFAHVMMQEDICSPWRSHA